MGKWQKSVMVQTHQNLKSWDKNSKDESCNIEVYNVVKWKSLSHATLQPHGLWPARLLCPWNSPGQTTRVGSHSLLQAIFPTQGSNLGLPHCRRILYHLSHKGSPKIAYNVSYHQKETQKKNHCRNGDHWLFSQENNLK